jgi:hypothetical protein
VTRAGVEDNRELLLLWSTDVDRAEVSSFVRDDTLATLQWHILFVQLNHHWWACENAGDEKKQSRSLLCVGRHEVKGKGKFPIYEEVVRDRYRIGDKA